MGGITDNKKYNGWRNWATWNAYNVLTADEETYNWAINCKSKECLKRVFAQTKYKEDFKKENHNIDWNELLTGIKRR